MQLYIDNLLQSIHSHERIAVMYSNLSATWKTLAKSWKMIGDIPLTVDS
ncbi:MAG: hypothetical protein FWF56_00745 [Firmicutes bacterium]|nr:hypothetical protein [Bacillota bacterium]MCL1953183.1 hypothetical protein [Bacillota bacterium]